MPRRKKQSARSKKRDFVLSQPLDIPAKEVVERAKQAGMRIKNHYVYVVRSTAKHEKQAGRKKSQALTANANSTGKDEIEFRRLALALGLDKSKELLKETERRIEDVILGK